MQIFFTHSNTYNHREFSRAENLSLRNVQHFYAALLLRSIIHNVCNVPFQIYLIYSIQNHNLVHGYSECASLDQMADFLVETLISLCMNDIRTSRMSFALENSQMHQMSSPQIQPCHCQLSSLVDAEVMQKNQQERYVLSFFDYSSQMSSPQIHHLP